MPDAPSVPPGALPDFSSLLPAVDGGRLLLEADAALERIVLALRDAIGEDRKASGSLTLKISFTADRGMIETSGSVRAAEPPPRRGRSLFFLAGRFLGRQDPRQEDLLVRLPSRDQSPTRIVKD